MVAADAVAGSGIPSVILILDKAAHGTGVRVLCIIVIRTRTEGMCNRLECLAEGTVCRAVVECSHGIGASACNVAVCINSSPLSHKVTGSGCCGRRTYKAGNVCLGEGITVVGVDLNNLDLVTVGILEGDVIQELLVIYCIVGEVRGGELDLCGVSICIQTLRTGIAYVVNEAVPLIDVLFKGDLDGGITCIECRAKQVKAVNGVVVAKRGSICGPLSLSAYQRGNLEGDLIPVLVCKNVAQSCIVQRDGNGVCAGDACISGDVSLQRSVLRESQLQNGSDDCGSGDTVVDHLVVTKVYLINYTGSGGNTLNGYALAVVLLGCDIELSLVGCMTGDSGNLCIHSAIGQPACKLVGVLVVSSLVGCRHCGSCTVLVFFGGFNAFNNEGQGCPVICNVGCLAADCGQLKAKALPALEGQVSLVCVACIQRGNLAVSKFLGDQVAQHVEYDGVGSYVLGIYGGVGCICNCCGQLALIQVAFGIHPALEGIDVSHGAVLGGQLAVVGGNLAVCEDAAVKQSAVLVHEGDGVLVCYVLGVNNGIGGGHCSQLVAISVNPDQIVAVLLQTGYVGREQRAAGQEALKQHLVAIHIGHGVQTEYVYNNLNLAGKCARGDVIGKYDGSAVSGEADVCKQILEPCTGIIGGIECPAEFTVALIGIGQLCILELCGDSVVQRVDQLVNVAVCGLSLGGIRDTVLVVGKDLNHALNDCLCALGADVQLSCNASNCLIHASAANKCVSILELGQRCQILIGNCLDQVVDRLDGDRRFLAGNRLGNLIDQDIAVLLHQINNGTDLSSLINDGLLVNAVDLYSVKQEVEYVVELLVGQQVKQAEQLANGCAFAKTLDNDLLGLIRNACVVECFLHSRGEYGGNGDLNVQVAILLRNKIYGSGNCLGTLADQLQVTLERDLQIKAVILLAISTQCNAVGCQHAVVTQIFQGGQTHALGQHSLLDAVNRDQLAVVACLHVSHQVDQLRCAVALNTEHLVAIDVHGVGLAAVHVHCSGLQECQDGFLICALRTAAANVTQNVTDDLVVVLGVYVDIQSGNAVLVYHFILAVVEGHAVYVGNDLLNDINGFALDLDISLGHQHVIKAPGYVLTCADRINCGLLDQLLVGILLLCNLLAVQYPAYGVNGGHVVGVLSLVLLLALLVLNGFLQIFNRSTVLYGVHDVVDAAEILFNNLAAGQNVGPGLLNSLLIVLCGPGLVAVSIHDLVPTDKGVGEVCIGCLIRDDACIGSGCTQLKGSYRGAVAGYKGNRVAILNGIKLGCGEHSHVASRALHSHDDGTPAYKGVAEMRVVSLDGGLTLIRGRFTVLVDFLGDHVFADHPLDGEFLCEHVVDHRIQVVQRFVFLTLGAIATKHAVRGLLKACIAVILFLYVVLHLFSSVGIVLDTVVLLKHTHQETEITACQRGQVRALCSERGNGDYRGQHCQTQHGNQCSATKFCDLLHWFFLRKNEF